MTTGAFLNITTRSFGGNGGSPFPLYNPLSFGGRSGALVDNIILNGQSNGGGGGLRETITFADNEYINSFTIRSGKFVDSFGFTTNKGRSWGPYGGSGGNLTTLNNIFVLGIGGRSGRLVDALTIRYAILRMLNLSLKLRI